MEVYSIWLEIWNGKVQFSKLLYLALNITKETPREEVRIEFRCANVGSKSFSEFKV